jgi:hypothetical protein
LWDSKVSFTVPKSKTGLGPVQKPHIHTYEGGFSTNTVDRFIENDLNGRLGVIGMPGEQWNKMINTIRDKAR